MTWFSSWSDTSGTQSDKHILVTCAVVSDVQKWTRFERDWLAILDDEKITALHMSELEHGDGEYVGWKGDTVRRNAFLERLRKAAKTGVRKVFLTGVDLAAYRDFDSRYSITETLGGAYSAGQLNCYLRALNWLGSTKTKGSPHQFEFSVEQGDTGQDAFLRFMDAHDMPVATLPKESPNGKRWRPFEFADMFAYEHRRLYQLNVKGQIWTTRWREPLVNLRRTIPYHAGIVDAAALQQWASDGYLLPLTTEQIRLRVEKARKKKRRP